MALITANPFLLKNATLKVDADNYETSVSTVEIVPTSSPVTWKGLTPSAVFTGNTASTWVANLSYAQDWETTNSLSLYLLENEGETVVMDFYPEAGGKGFRVTVNIISGSIGGAVDTVAVGTVSLGVVGKPSIITP